MALTMFDRARWTAKGEEAEVFRHWLTGRLEEAVYEPSEGGGEDEGAAEPETLP